ncbi:Abi-alpha family protein [Nocardia altamirensis]|uniref:Abi-alpha family protein n=1 Tax=Nocardia altamirensis TaxID=472158 RepID=UPI0008400EC3|nr:Abi-alpha family protein [Nocardia altamirensis]
MAVAKSDPGDDAGAAGHPPEAVAPSTELARRPDSEIVRADESPSRVPVPIATVRAATGVARVAWSAFTGVTAWSLGTAVGVTSTVVARSIQGVSPREVLAEAESEVRDRMRQALGLPEVPNEPAAHAVPTLREQGAALLRWSPSTNDEDENHPAFAGMLAELTPDEARVLRFLHLDGPQPSIDIRTGRPRALGAERLGSMLTLVGEQAGLRFPNRIQQYLTNLRRLGLIEHEREPVGNPQRYQLLEAQTTVRELLKRSGFGTKVIYRSVALTGFGTDFVRTCLPVAIQDDRAAGH